MKTPFPLPQAALRARGFTLLEVLVALSVMGIAGLGAIAGLTAATQNLRSGQLRQVEMALLDAKSARLMLMEKSALIKLAQPRPTAATSPDLLAVGDTTAWTPDPSTGDDNDIGAGAYFYFLPNGQIHRIIPGVTTYNGVTIAANTPCATAKSPGTFGGTSGTSAALPAGAGGPYCREIAVTTGLPPAGGTMPDTMNTQVLGTGAKIYTLWIRVSRVGEPDSAALVQREVFTQ